MGTNEKNTIKLRILVVGLFFGALFVAIGAKAVHLQVFQGELLTQRAENQYERSLAPMGKRGTIYDANGEEMAVTIDVMSIAVRPGEVKDRAKAVSVLSRALKMKRRDVRKKLKSKSRFVWLKRQAPPKITQAVKALKLKGVSFVKEHKRYYPNTSLAAQALGFAGLDSKGLEGLEFQYNGELSKAEDKVRVIIDAQGRRVEGDMKTVENYAGDNLVLTIDRSIQYITEEALQKVAVEFDATNAMAVVMNPNTGAILSLAHFPAFNPNSYGSFSRELWRNRAITDPFEPGSTMKIFLAAAAIESGYCSANTIFYCENGKYRVGRNTVHDTHPRDWLSLSQIVKYSSNIGVVKVSEMIGKKTLYDSLRSFGFGSKTGIDCPGETTGSLSNYKRWTKIDTGTIAFGQGVSASALQIVRAASVIANGGLMVKPHLVQAITDNTGNEIWRFTPERGRRVISKSTSDTVKEIMHTVVKEGGTGTNAALDDFAVCGKTGTAQKVAKTGGYAKNKYVSSFLGFAPMDNPELTVLVVLDEPRRKHYGGVVAAPAFKTIVHETLNYLDVAPQRVADGKRNISSGEGSG